MFQHRTGRGFLPGIWSTSSSPVGLFVGLLMAGAISTLVIPDVLDPVLAWVVVAFAQRVVGAEPGLGAVSCSFLPIRHQAG